MWSKLHFKSLRINKGSEGNKYRNCFTFITEFLFKLFRFLFINYGWMQNKIEIIRKIICKPLVVNENYILLQSESFVQAL
jgi:hypothetical protein